LAQRRPVGARARRAHAAQADPGASTLSRSARSKPSSVCCAAASSTRCSRRAGRHRSCAASHTSSGCFPNTRAAEQAYYEKTRMFPIMHLVGIRKELVQKYPWLPSSVYKAFCEAKALAMIDLLDINALMVTHPWLIAETEETMAIMGKDFWSYGINKNMREITALTQYLHEQDLIDRKVVVEELFRPSMFEISKV
jgi:hypothetical protein